MPLAWMRLTEHPARTAMLVATIGVAVLAWVVLSALASPFLASQAGKTLDATLGVVNGRVNGEPMPVRYARQIEQIPGVVEVGYVVMAGFVCADERTVVSVNALGGSKAVSDVRRYAETLRAADLTAWNDTRNGLLVSSELAQHCGLTPGTTIFPQDILTDVEMPFHIIALLPENPDYGTMAFGHYDYVNQMQPEEDRRNQTQLIRVSGDNPARLPELTQTIERMFASADPPVDADVASDPSLIGRYGQVQALLDVVMAAMAACALLVFLTVLAHQVTQRRASMAALQTIGFDRRMQFGGLVLEVILIMLAGTALGMSAGFVTLTLINPQVFWLIGHLHTPAWALWSLAPALLLLALLTLAWPALQVSRLKPIDHLRV